MKIGNSGTESRMSLAKRYRQNCKRMSLGLSSKRIYSQCVGLAIVVGEKGSAAGPISRQFL